MRPIFFPNPLIDAMYRGIPKVHMFLFTQPGRRQFTPSPSWPLGGGHKNTAEIMPAQNHGVVGLWLHPLLHYQLHTFCLSLVPKTKKKCCGRNRRISMSYRNIRFGWPSFSSVRFTVSLLAKVLLESSPLVATFTAFRRSRV